MKINNYYYNIFLEKAPSESSKNLCEKYKWYIWINVSKRIDINKKRELKECNICHYWYRLNKGFKFQQIVYNECYDLVMISMNFSNIAISNIKGSDYCYIISGIS